MKLAMDTLTLDDVITASDILKEYSRDARQRADALNKRHGNYLRASGYLLSRAESCDKVADVLLSGTKVE